MSLFNILAFVIGILLVIKGFLGIKNKSIKINNVWFWSTKYYHYTFGETKSVILGVILIILGLLITLPFISDILHILRILS